MLSVTKALACFIARLTLASALALMAVVAWADDTPGVQPSIDSLANGRPLSDERLAELRGTGDHFRLSATDQIGAPRQIAVILWDESRTGRPAPRSGHDSASSQTNVVATRR